MTEKKCKFTCNQEGIVFVVTCHTLPTHCPNDINHTISIMETHNIESIRIKEEFLQDGQIPTNGYFKCQGFSETCIANSVTEFVYSWLYPISPTVIKLNVRSIHQGDKFDTYIAKDTTIGVITSNLTIGTTVLPVSTTVINNIKPGFLCKITDGVNTNELGEVLSVNTTNNTITITTPPTNDFNTNSFIKMTIHNIKDFYLYDTGPFIIGDSRIGSSYLPPNIPITLSYTNNSETNKVFNWVVEYMY